MKKNLFVIFCLTVLVMGLANLYGYIVFVPKDQKEIFAIGFVMGTSFVLYTSAFAKILL
jgi:hypothetical protein